MDGLLLGWGCESSVSHKFLLPLSFTESGPPGHLRLLKEEPAPGQGGVCSELSAASVFLILTLTWFPPLELRLLRLAFSPFPVGAEWLHVVQVE